MLTFLSDSGDIVNLTVVKAADNIFNIDTNTLFLKPDEYAQFESMNGDPHRKEFIAKIPKFSRYELK